MINELGYAIDQMDMGSVKDMVQQLKSRGTDISLEDRIRLYFGLLKMNYLDSAMFQMQMIYNEIKDKGLNNDFVSKHPDLKIQLMAVYDIWEDSCGNIHIGEASNCDDCGSCGSCGCGCFGVLLAITMCFGAEGLISIQSFVEGCCEDDGCCRKICCNDCCTTICEDGCGCGCGPGMP